MPNIQMKRNWRAYLPGFPPGEELRISFCPLCQRYLGSNPDIAATIHMEKDRGREAAEMAERDDPEADRVTGYVAAPTCLDPEERLFARYEVPHHPGVYQHVFTPGLILHSKALEWESSHGFPSIADLIKVGYRKLGA